MKIKNIKIYLAVAVMGLGLTSCEDFLDRPAEDKYVAGSYYRNDTECIAAVNYLYNSPWYDFQRGFICLGDVLAGNYYWTGGDSQAFIDFSFNSNNEHIRNMAYSLWAVNGHSNIVRHYIEGGGASEAVKKQTMGECLLWKAMAYFYLVRTFGDVPIVHDNSEMIEKGTYNEQYKVQKADVYEYIVMTLEKAIEWLPEQCTEGRLDKYCAKGLLAKVYLAKAGVSGQLNSEDLQKAAEYAKDVMDNCGRELEKNYADCFTLEGNKSKENMIAWRWTPQRSKWTSQNSFQSDLGIQPLDEYGDNWGAWSGVSVDLQDAFGFNILDEPGTRPDVDTRRKATFMTVGDVIPYLWRDHGGLDYTRFHYDTEYNEAALGQCNAPTGANCVKHLYGNNADHVSVLGVSAANMTSGLCTPLLRLADVYLVLAEAKVLMGQGSDADALKAFNAVHQRAIPNATAKTSLTFDDVWKERRLELALEGDRWYDFVRLSYYNPERAISEIKGQRRNSYWNLNPMFKNYYKTGQWQLVNKDDDGNDQTAMYDDQTPAPNVTIASFTIPFPMEDLTFNPHLKEDAVHVDVRETFKY